MPGQTQRQVIDRITENTMRVLRGQENQNVNVLIDAYRGAQDDIIQIVQNSMNQLPGMGQQWTIAQMAAGGRDQQLLFSINQRLQQLGVDQETIVSNGMSEQLRSSLARTGYGLDQGTPSRFRVQVPVLPEQQIRALIATPFEGAMFSQRLGAVSAEMAGNIQTQLTRSMINGESMPQAAARVRGVLGASNVTSPRSLTNRATTIARTEIMRAQNLGKFAVYGENSDLVEGDPARAWIWVVTPDDRLCPWCLRREGKTPAQIEKLPQGRDPWKKSTELPLHPHCRCTSYPKLRSFRSLGIDMPENFRADQRGVRDPATGKWTVQPVESFEKWLSERSDVPTA